jgi:hypothetical protein
MAAPTFAPHTILGVHVTQRVKEALEVQRHLTEFGRYIKTRVGLHEIEKSSDAPNGLILLEMVGPNDKILELQNKLNAIAGVEVKSLTFEH